MPVSSPMNETISGGRALKAEVGKVTHNQAFGGADGPDHVFRIVQSRLFLGEIGKALAPDASAVLILESGVDKQEASGTDSPPSFSEEPGQVEMMDGVKGEHAVEVRVGKGQSLSPRMENVKLEDVQQVQIDAKLFKHVLTAIDERDEQLLAKPAHEFDRVAPGAASHVRRGHGRQARQGTNQKVDRLRIREPQIVVSGGDAGEVVRN